MKVMRAVNLLGLFMVLMGLSTAHAQYAQKCQAAGQASDSACKSAASSATAADNGQAASNMASSGTAINPNSGKLAGQAGAQATRLNGAKNNCLQEQQKCSSECDQQKQMALADQQAVKRGEPAQVDQAKQSACIAPIAPTIASLSKGAGDASAAQGASNDTKGASNGSSIPSMPSSASGSPNSNPTPATAPTTPSTPAVDCTVAGNSTYSICNDAYLQKCTGNLGGTDCGAFSARYCALSGSPLSPPTTSLMGGQMVTSGQVGEGVGSNYCNTATAYDFCVNHTGRSSCSTCVNYQASQTQACLQNPASCMAVNSSATASSCPVPEPILGGNSTPVAASGSSNEKPATSTADLIVPTVQSHLAAQSLRRTVATTNVASSFAPASTNSEEADGAEKNETKIRKKLGMGIISTGTIRGTSTGLAAPAHIDVAAQYGPSLFNIGSDTYGKLCAAGRLKCEATAGY